MEGTAESFLPRAKGSYVLVLWLAESRTIKVGKLGQFDFRTGYYLYVGSAFGAGGLAGRLKHHLNPRKLHWHIDYLRAIAELQEIWFTAEEQRRECQWAAELAKLPQCSRPYPGFGSTDCRCVSHLFYCSAEQAVSEILNSLSRWKRLGG